MIAGQRVKCIISNRVVQGLIVDAPGYTKKVLVAFDGKVEWLEESCLKIMENINIDNLQKICAEALSAIVKLDDRAEFAELAEKLAKAAACPEEPNGEKQSHKN